MSAQAQPKCCYIAPGPDRRGCEKPAVWTIQNTTPGADPYDYTEACDAHVSDLLTDGAQHAVYPLGADAPPTED